MTYILAAWHGPTLYGYYTGRSGDGWISGNRSESFAYASNEEASRKANIMNRMTPIHGQTFEVETF